MLHIENIDLYSIRFGSGYGGGDHSKVYPKSLEARKDEKERIWIWHTENNEAVLNVTPVGDVLLNNVAHATAEAFVVAFNALMADATPFVTTTTTTIAVTTTTTTGA